MKQRKRITGIGVNVITEIMTTYNSKDFAVLNKRSIEAITKLGCKTKGKEYYIGTDYQRFCNLMDEIRATLNMRSLLQTDILCNYIYQLTRKKKKRKK